MQQIDLLIHQAKFEEALEKLQSVKHVNQFSESEKLALYHLESTIYLKMGKFEEGKKIAEQLLIESQEYGDKQRELDGIINLIWALLKQDKIRLALDMVEKGEKVLKLLDPKQYTPELKTREAKFYYYKGLLFSVEAQIIEALNSLEKSLLIREELGDKKGIAESLAAIGSVYSKSGKLDQALEYLQKCLLLRKEIDDQSGESESYLRIGGAFLGKGELDSALEYFHKSMKLKEKIGYQRGLDSVFNYIGIVYYYKGELDSALEYFRKCLVIREEFGHPASIGVALGNIGEIFACRGDFQSATNYFEKALNIYKKHKIDGLIVEVLYQSLRFFVKDLPPETVTSYLNELNEINERRGSIPIVNQKIRLAQAIVLKTSKRIIDKATAQAIFQQVAEEEIIWHELTVEAMLNLGDLLIFELDTTGDEAVLNEVQELTEKLLTLAKDQNSYWLLTETYLLKSKLALLQLDLKKAKSLLNQAKQLATERGLKKLVKTVSQESDALIAQLSKWEEIKIKKEKSTMSERIELAQLRSLLERVIQKRHYYKEKEIVHYTEEMRQIVDTWGRGN